MKKTRYTKFEDGFSDHKAKVKTKASTERKKRKSHQSVDDYFEMYEKEQAYL